MEKSKKRFVFLRFNHEPIAFFTGFVDSKPILCEPFQWPPLMFLRFQLLFSFWFWKMGLADYLESWHLGRGVKRWQVLGKAYFLAKNGVRVTVQLPGKVSSWLESRFSDFTDCPQDTSGLLDN